MTDKLVLLQKTSPLIMNKQVICFMKLTIGVSLSEHTSELNGGFFIYIWYICHTSFCKCKLTLLSFNPKDCTGQVQVRTECWKVALRREKQDYSEWAPISTKGWQLKPLKREKQNYSRWALTSVKGWQLKPPRREKGDYSRRLQQISTNQCEGLAVGEERELRLEHYSTR